MSGCTGRCRKGTGAERDNGARARAGRCRRPGQRAIRVHGDGARVHCPGPCTFSCTRAPSPCTVIARCPGSPAPSRAPVHRPVHRYRALPRSPAPSRAPVHRPRAPISRSGSPAPSRARPCTVIALCPGPFLHLPVHPDTVPVHRYRALPRSPAPSRARPCTVIALCPGPFLHLPVHPDTVPVHRYRAREGAGEPGQSAITVHGDGVWVHGKVQEGTGAERDDGARACTGRCRGPRARYRCTGTVHGCTGRCRGPGQSAITVHGDGVWVHGKVQEGTGAERDNGARACTGRCRGPGQRAITVHGDGARVHRGRCRQGRAR